MKDYFNIARMDKNKAALYKAAFLLELDTISDKLV
jgi:hypothetical protein